MSYAIANIFYILKILTISLTNKKLFSIKTVGHQLVVQDSKLFDQICIVLGCTNLFKKDNRERTTTVIVTTATLKIIRI